MLFLHSGLLPSPRFLSLAIKKYSYIAQNPGQSKKSMKTERPKDYS